MSTCTCAGGSTLEDALKLQNDLNDDFANIDLINEILLADPNKDVSSPAHDTRPKITLLATTCCALQSFAILSHNWFSGDCQFDQHILCFAQVSSDSESQKATL